MRSVSPAVSATEAPARRRWGTAALWSAALLVVPLLGWLFFPVPEVQQRSKAVPHGDEAPATAAPIAAGVSSARPPAAARSAAPQAEASAASLDGVVLDPDGHPAADASITCVLGEREVTAGSDDAGRFKIAADAAGCKAVARKKGLGPSAETELRAGGTTELRLTPPMGIAGNVVDETGAPVMTFIIGIDAFEPAGGGGGAADAGAGARPAPVPSRRQEIDDVEGAFEWTDLPAGRYVLAVTVPQGPMARGQSIEVKPGAMTKGVRLLVTPGVTVVGTVTDATTGERVDGARVFALMGGMQTRLSWSRGGGEFKVEGAPSGRFDLHVVHPRYAEHVAHDVEAPPGGSPLRVNVSLHRATTEPPPGP